MNNKSNPIQIPNYLNEKIMKLTKHFGTIVEDTIYESISNKISSLDENTITSLNNIFKRSEINHRAVEESIKEMSSVKHDRISFWNSILESSLNLTEDYKNSLKNIISLIEAENMEHIEGDGEDPNADTSHKNQDETDQEDSQEDSQESQPQLNPDQLLQIELAQTDNKFLTIVLYDKIIELINTIDTIKDSISSSKTEENLNLFEDLIMYRDYLNILSELIFVMDLNTVYYNFTNISLEVNNLLDKYLVSTKLKSLNNPKISENDKKEIINTLKDNLKEKNETDQEIQDEGNE